MRNFTFEPPPNAQRKKRQTAGKKKGRERGICNLSIKLSGVHRRGRNAELAGGLSKAGIFKNLWGLGTE
jgi:hypothetical protein